MNRTLLAAARQALPGLDWKWEAEPSEVGAHLFGQSYAIIERIAPGVYYAHTLGETNRCDTDDEAAQWLRAQVTARRDALDAALGEKHIGTSAREAWVPVAERLPPLGQEVDLWDGFGRLADCKRDGDESMWDWFNVNGDPIGDVPGTGEPTHWREKPLPPNG